MKKFVLLGWLLFLSGLSLIQAQSRLITGKVTNADDGSAVPGVTITVKEIAGLGTITDFDGNYRIEIPANAKTLVSTFVGMQTKQVNIGNQSVINVQMKTEEQGLGEVVVTAIGIKKSEKSLGYSTTQVSGDEITKSHDKSVLNALQGKIAGVNISSASGSPGASTRIILRGFSSLTQNNQPLFVVDGVPIDNSSYGSTSINGGLDFGNGVNDLSPDDIENIAILKGASSAALYGSRAANGVVLITTKKGKQSQASKGTEITVSSSASFDSPLRIPEMQNKFGQGILGAKDIRENTSWGPRFDEKMRYWGYEVDGQRQIKPYKALENNVKDFFDIGKTYTNSISFAGGNEQASYYMSYSNVASDGIMPTNADSYSRNTLSLRGSANFSNNFSSSAGINYVKKNASFVTTGQGGQSAWNNILQIPRDISIVDMANYKNKWNNLDNYYSAYMLNPYYALNEYGNNSDHDRIYGNVEVSYKFNSHLNATFRTGSDVTTEQISLWRPITFPKGNNFFNQSWVNTDEGSVSETSIYNRQFNTDFIISYNRSFGKFDLNMMLGHNMNERNSRVLWQEVKDLDIPGFYHLSNTASSPTIGKYEDKRRLVGIYGSIDFDYNHYLYLTITSRNDWSSTLPENNRSFFYPGVNLSFVFSDAFESLQTYIPYGKLRIGWAQTGNDAPPYSIHSVFAQAGHSDGYESTSLRYPLPGPINAFEVGNTIGNPKLQPEINTEFELGTDLRFFTDRLSFDFTYYNKSVTDLIFQVPLAYTSGYSDQTMNLGEISNKGIELLVNVVPVKTTALKWDFSVNFSRNRSKLVKLAKGLDQALIIGMSESPDFVAIPGYPLCVYTAQVPKKDPLGRIVVDNVNGIPVPAEEEEIVGDSNYDFMAGITNQITYNGFSLSFNFDIRYGGMMWSRTASQLYFSGTANETLFNGRQPFIVPNSVVESGKDENDEPIYKVNTTPVTDNGLYNFWSNGGTDLERKELIDKSFVKFRELSLIYNFPPKWLDKTFIGSASVSITGRNLFVWTPKSNQFIDPELTTFGNDLAADYGEFGATPSVRSIGMNLRFTF